MASILVMGGDMGGLSTAMLLATDGHDVTVLERGPAPPPASGDEAWDRRERKVLAAAATPAEPLPGPSRAELVELVGAA